MIGAFGCDQPAVLLKSCLVNILLDGKFGQNFVIAGMFCDISVGEHALYFACIAPIVSFVIPLECILGVVMQIYGYLVAGSPWYIEYQDIAPVVFAILHVFLLQDVCAAMSLVVYVVPKLFFVFARLLQCDAVKCEFPVLLFDAQYDDSTLRIGESGVGFPQAARKPSPGGFELHLGRFTVGHQRFDFFYKIWKKCIGVLTRGCPVSYICRTIHSRPAGTAKLSTSGNASVSAFCELLSPFIDKF